MIRTNSAELKRNFSDATKTQVIEQPNLIDNSKIIPTIDVTPFINRKANVVRRAFASNTISATVMTTPAIGDFYITSASLQHMKDVTSPTTTIRLNAIINGVSTAIMEHVSITLTADSVHTNQDFSCPIKVDRNTAITITADSAVANVRYGAILVGYYDEGM